MVPRPEMASIERESYQNRLTSLYHETNYLCDVVAAPPHVSDAPELQDLQQRFRYQKDRLLTWGERWSGATVDVALARGSIDYSSAQAGCTEVVTAVLSHVKDLLNQAEEIQRSLSSMKRNPISRVFPGEKTMLDGDRWATLSKALYEDLVKDLAGSIDTLYDLLRARDGSVGDRTASDVKKSTTSPLMQSDVPPSQNTNLPSSQELEPNPALSGPLPEIDYHSLFLVEERCYAYEGVEPPAGSRFVAKLCTSQDYSQNQATNKSFDTPVLIEYAPSNLLDQLRGVPSPAQSERVRRVCEAYALSTLPIDAVLRCLGFFYDPAKSRCGLVYSLPTSRFSQSTLEKGPWEDFRPRSLQQLLQMSSRASNTSMESRISTPALEVRFSMALELATTLQRIHESGRSLGNLNSSNIIFFQDKNSATSSSTRTQSNSDLRHPFLSPFDLAGGTLVHSDNSPVINIYLHPEAAREDGSVARGAQQAGFDLYSLGLILLEVGLWVPLRSLFKSEYSLAGFKRRLQGTYVTHKLPGICGTIYTQVVQDCLSSTVGSQDLYSSIVCRLAKCALLDEAAQIQTAPPPSRVSPLTTSAETTSTASMSQALSFREFRRKVVLVQRHWRKVYARILVERRHRQLRHTVQAYRLEPLGPHKCPAERCPYHMLGFPTEPERDRHYQDRHDFPSSLFACQYDGCPYKSKRQNNVSVHMDRCHGQSRHSDAGPLSASNLTRSPSLTSSRTHPHIFTPVNLSRPVLDNWHCNILPHVGRIVDRAIGASKESLSIGLVAMGKSLEEARLTLLVECESKALVKSTLRQELDLGQIGCDLKVCRGGVRRSKGVRTRHLSPHRSNKDEVSCPRNTHYQKQPLCGASIGAYTGEHLPAASFGGVVLIDEEPYGMTVHHMLDAPSDSEDAESDYDCDSETDDEDYDSADRSTAFTSIAHDGADAVAGGDQIRSSYRTSSTSEDEAQGFQLTDQLGDRPGVEQGLGELLKITQPAIDDADDDLFPDLEDRDDDHLASHELGYVHASSGIRRWRLGNEAHEVDWALLKINSSRLHTQNVVIGGRRYCPTGNPNQGLSLQGLSTSTDSQQEGAGEIEDLYPTEVAKARELGRRPVHCLGRTSGLQTGIISPAMSYVRIHGRTTPSVSWSVIGDFGAGGDSGAWIIDNLNGQVCGHVLARSSKTRITYLCPMQLMLEDMRRQLGAECIRLPGGAPQPVGETLDELTRIGSGDGAENVDTALDLPNLSNLDLESIRRSREQSAKPAWTRRHNMQAWGHNNPLSQVTQHQQLAQG